MPWHRGGGPPLLTFGLECALAVTWTVGRDVVADNVNAR
jgi:hypothetical protein